MSKQINDERIIIAIVGLSTIIGRCKANGEVVWLHSKFAHCVPSTKIPDFKDVNMGLLHITKLKVDLKNLHLKVNDYKV